MIDRDTPEHRYFTAGPVQMDPKVAMVGGEQVPYFRNQRFSDLVIECEQLMLQMVNAPEGSRVVFLTTSGTGGLEASIVNYASPDQASLVLNGGGFGQRLVEIAASHGRPVCEFVQQPTSGYVGGTVDAQRTYSAILANMHETSNGAYNDVDAFYRNHVGDSEALFIVDAISAFLCDPLDMSASGIDVVVLASHKALGLAPGIAPVVISPRAVDLVLSRGPAVGAYYFDLAPYLLNGARGQTPFTPAVAVMMQMHVQLKRLSEVGVNRLVSERANLAQHFRKRVVDAGLPFGIHAPPPSNAITALETKDLRIDAAELVRYFDECHGVYLTPNGGTLASRVLRVSHMGEQNVDDLDRLVDLLGYYVDERVSSSAGG